MLKNTELKSKPYDIDDQYLDLKTLAEYSSISVRTLRYYINESPNPIPCYRIERKILVWERDFDRDMYCAKNLTG